MKLNQLVLDAINRDFNESIVVRTEMSQEEQFMSSVIVTATLKDGNYVISLPLNQDF